MTLSSPRLTLTHLTFTGPGREAVGLDFVPGLNVLYGASNTGKSFAVKVIDFMLGGTKALPDISERIGYEQAWMAMNLPKTGDATLVRALAGGSFELHGGHITATPPDRKNNRQLSARNNPASTDNISQFLLDELGLTGREVATDVHGKKRPLSFRDLTRFCVVDETSIQSETSPAESGQYISPTVEHSVFKLLLTGQDDSAVVPVLDRKTFKTSTSAKMEVLDELLLRVNDELEADYPDADGLAEQHKRLEDSWAQAKRDAQAAQESIRGKLATKNRLARSIYDREQLYAEIQINFGRFEQLESVYKSDIKRLEAIEEAGFVLSLGGEKPCPLCGATPEDQRHSHGMSEIRKAQAAANVEIGKIKKQQIDLRLTIERLNNEGLQIEKTLE